jgi:hypothetical protein
MRGTAPEFAIEHPKKIISRSKRLKFRRPFAYLSRGYADLLHKLPFLREECA